MPAALRIASLPRLALLAFCLTPPGSFADDVAGKTNVRGELDVPSDLQWTDVGSEERVPVLELLEAQTRANYEKIHTWRGNYSVRVKQNLTAGYVLKVFGGSLPKGPATALRQEFQLHLKFAIDTAASAVFRDQETIRMELFRPGAERPIPIKDRESVDYRTIMTPEHFVRFSPKSVFPGFFVADVPEAQNKHAAFREPAEDALPRDTGDAQDPRNFFGNDGRSKFWDALNLECAGSA